MDFWIARPRAEDISTGGTIIVLTYISLKKKIIKSNMIFAMTCYGIAKAIQCIYILDYVSLKCGIVYSHSLKLSTMT